MNTSHLSVHGLACSSKQLVKNRYGVGYISEVKVSVELAAFPPYNPIEFSAPPVYMQLLQYIKKIVKKWIIFARTYINPE